MMNELKDDTRDIGGRPLAPRDPKGIPYLNPVALMADSKARGSVDNFRQLSGMRGLMSRPSGEIMETPIKTNFREGLSVLEYFTSTHGARKGLADTALKTADSGYLTRKLADVAQNVIVSKHDCGTQNGIRKSAIYKGEQIDVPLREAIIGRCSSDTIINPITDEVIVREGQIITETIATKIENLNIETVRVRSPLTCESFAGVCAKLLRRRSLDRQARRRRPRHRHHRRAVHRRTGHAAHHAYLPHRRRRQRRRDSSTTSVRRRGGHHRIPRSEFGRSRRCTKATGTRSC